MRAEMVRRRNGRRQYTTCVSGMAAYDWSLDDELAMYRRLDTGAVGLPWLKLRARGPSRAQRDLARSGLHTDYLVYPLSADPEDARACRHDDEMLAAAIDFAYDIGARLVYLTSGRSGSLVWEDAAERLARRLRPLARRAREADVLLAIENTSPVLCDLSFTHTARDALALAEQAETGVCLDLYCAWQERDLAATVAAGIDSVHLVQVSDFRIGTQHFPNRWVPGDADLPLGRLLGDVLAAGYTGVIDLELRGPAIDEEGAESSLRRGLAWIERQLTP